MLSCSLRSPCRLFLLLLVSCVCLFSLPDTSARYVYPAPPAVSPSSPLSYPYGMTSCYNSSLANTSTCSNIPTSKWRNIVRISFLGPVTPPIGNAINAVMHAFSSFLMAVSEINLNPNLLPNTFLEVLLGDTRGDVGITTYLATQHMNLGTSFVMGEYSSTNCQQVGYVTRFADVPQVSYSCTATDFSNKVLYPTFMRIVNSISIGATNGANVCKQLGWIKVALIYNTDAFSLAAGVAFKKRATELGIEILTFQSYESGLDPKTANIDFQVNIIKNTNAKIIVSYLATSDDTTIFFRTAKKMGLTGTGYQHLGGVITTALTNDPTLIDTAQGLIQFDHYLDMSSTIYSSFISRYQQFVAPPQYGPNLNGYVNYTKGPQFRAFFAYDPTYLMAYALHQAIEVEGYPVTQPPDRNTLKRVLAVSKNLTFDGLVGHIELDDKGDRWGNSSVKNIQGADTFDIGYVDEQGRVLINEQKIKYAGIGLRPVSDAALSARPLSSSIRAGLLIIAIISMVLVACVMAAIIFYKDRPSIRSASAPFLILMLFGSMLVFASIISRTYETLKAEDLAKQQYDTLQPESKLSPYDTLSLIGGCYSEFWLLNIGYIIYISALLAKNFRIHKIFNNKTTRMIKALFVDDMYLFVYSVILVLLDAIILIVLYFADPLYIRRMPSFMENAAPDHVVLGCDSKQGLTTDWYPPLFAYRFVLLACLSSIAYLTRHISARFNESTHLVATSYNLTAISILFPILEYSFERGTERAIIATSICILVEQYISLSILLVPKFLLLHDLNGAYVNTQGTTRHDSSGAGKKSSHGSQQHKSSKVRTTASSPSHQQHAHASGGIHSQAHSAVPSSIGSMRGDRRRSMGSIGAGGSISHDLQLGQVDVSYDSDAHVSHDTGVGLRIGIGNAQHPKQVQVSLVEATTPTPASAPTPTPTVTNPAIELVGASRSSVSNMTPQLAGVHENHRSSVSSAVNFI